MRVKRKDDYTIKRGEIYYILQGDTSDEIGSEQRSGRPAIIVSNEMNNLHSSIVEVVFLTTRQKKELPTHISINSSHYDSIALCEQIKTFDKCRIGDYVGIVTDDEMKELERAMAISLGIIDITENNGDGTALERAKALEEALVETQQMLMDSEFEAQKLEMELENLKCDSEANGGKSAGNAQKYKTERDVYKKMYEQLLERVLTGTDSE